MLRGLDVAEITVTERFLKAGALPVDTLSTLYFKRALPLSLSFPKHQEGLKSQVSPSCLYF